VRRCAILLVIVVVLLATPFFLAFVHRSFVAYGAQSPIASFIYSPEIPRPDETITFDASASYDPDGRIVRYAWDFGDGNVASVTDPIVTHSYPLDGTYTVELTVTDDSDLTGVSAAIVEVSTEVYFRVALYGTLTPVPNIETTMYYKNGYTWMKAPVGSCYLEIRYDNMTQPDLADTPAERYRNPGFTASVLRFNASNIGFDIHPSSWTVFFKFKWGDVVTYWPNDTTRVYTYKDGAVQAHDYSSGHGAYWDSTAGTYVIRAKDIPGSGVSPTQDNPILVGAFCPPPPTNYYLTVRTDPSGVVTIPGEGWYAANTNVTLTAPAYVNVSANTRYRFTYWDVNGTSQGSGVNPINVFMNANRTATAHYVTQYAVVFNQTGLSSDATGTVVTVNGSVKAFAGLPYTLWVDSGGSVTYSYNSIVTSSVSGKQFRLNSVSGPTSPITVSGPVTVAGNYVTQYLVTFAQTGLDSTATGTVVTVNGSAKTFADLPYNWWVDSGATVTYSYSSIVSSSITDKQFRLTGVYCPLGQFVVTGPVTITGGYCIQYKVTFRQTGLDSTATGTVVIVNGSAKTYSQLPYSLWVDSGSSVTYSYTSIVSSSYPDKQFRLNSVTGPTSPITVTAPIAVTGNYVTQYQVTFAQTGLDSTATGTVVTLNGTAKTFTNLPYTLWVDSGGSVTYSYSTPVSSSTTGKRFRLDTVSGPSSPITVSGATTVTGNYVTQYQVTFAQTGLDSTATGTVVIANGSVKSFADLPYALWVDSGGSVTYSYSSTVTSSVSGKQFRLNTVTGPASPVTVTAPTTVTGNYVSQYLVTFAQTGLDSTASGTVVTINGSAKNFAALPYSFWVDSGSSVTYSYSSIVSSSYSNKQFRLTGVTGPSSPITVTGSTTITGNYVTQYLVTFTQTGLDATATGTVVTVNGSAKTYSQLPYGFWVDSGGSVTYSFSSPVSSSTPNKQFRLDTVSGPSSPITVSGATTATGNYIVQYRVTFAQTGLDSTATGTVVTIDGNAKTYGNLPFSMWVDSGGSVTYSYSSIVSSSVPGKQFRLNTVSGPTSPITVTGPTTVTGNYVTQYLVTFTQTGLDSTATGTVVTVNGNTKEFADLPFALWVDSGSSVTYSYSNVSSSTTGKRFILTGVSGPSSPITVTNSATVTGNYKTQYKVTFDQSGVGSDFVGTVVTVDSVNYSVAGLPVDFWWDQGTNHNFAFASPLTVNASKQYAWSSTSGLSTLQSGTLTISVSGSVTGNYIVQNCVTFDQVGASSDFTSTVVTVDGTPYGVSALPVSFYWQLGTVHNFAFQSPLVVTANSKQYVWTSTTGLSTLQNGSINVTSFGSIVGHYKTQYYLNVTTNPTGLNSPSGSGWYDDGTYAPISTEQYVPGGSRWRFAGWTTGDMSEITDPSSPSTTVFVDMGKTVTVNYIHQYLITFAHTGLASDASGTVVTVNGTAVTYSGLPYSLWVDVGGIVNYSYGATVSSTMSGKQFSLTGVTGPSSPITVNADTNVTGNYKIQYYLTVTSPYATAGGQGWYDSGATAYATLNTGTADHGNGTRHVFTNWNGDASGTNYAQSNPITMNAAKTAVAQWKTQHCVTFTHSGLDSSATGTVVTVNSVAKTYGDLPYALWVDAGASATYAYSNVSSSTTGKRFILTGVTGPASPITVTGPLTVTGNYKTQHQITFNQSGVSSDFTGTVVTVDSTGYAFGVLPASFWWDNGSSHTFAFQSPLVVTANAKQYIWTSTTGLSTLQSGSLTVSGSGSVTGNYGTQYYLTVASPYGVTGGQGWYDSDATAHATLDVGSVDHGNGTRHVFTNWNGDATGTNYASSDPIAMNGPKTAIARWKAQHTVTFTHSGLDSSASGTVVNVNSTPVTYGQLPYIIWVDSGSSVTYSYSNVSSSITGKRFILIGVSGPSSPIAVTEPTTVTGNYKTQHQITFNQTGVGSDFTGAIVTIDGTDYSYVTLPVSSWWDNGSSHTFSFVSPLIVNISRQYNWTSTTGLSTLQTGTLTITDSGNVTGNYNVEIKYQITFDKTGVSPDFAGTVMVIDGTNYNALQLPVSFWWNSGSSHTFAYLSPLELSPNSKRYVWVSTSGPWPVQNGTVIVSASGNVIGNYKTQYYLTLTADPSGITTPSGEGWYDAGTNATISTVAFVETVPNSTRYRFYGWTTANMSEIEDYHRTPTQVIMDEGKTVTALYWRQCWITFDQTGVDPNFTDTVVIVDGRLYNVTALPVSFWWDAGSWVHTFSYQSPLVVTPYAKQNVWVSTTGLSDKQSDTISINASGTITGNYKTQYYLAVHSLYDSPTPPSGYFDAGTSITASVTSSSTGPTGTRYVCTGWSGAGSVPSSGTGTNVTFTINQASSITWNWKTQYYLTVKTDPAGIAAIPGEGWYDEATSVALTAPAVQNYTFTYWGVDGVSRGNGVNPISVPMDAPHTATAHYTSLPNPLSVSINPPSATIPLGASVFFTSTVNGGTGPYTYQWYIGSNPVSGATSSTWTFTPTAGGTYLITLKVTDSLNNTAQSEPSRVTVTSGPIGGYAVPLIVQIPTIQLAAYVALVVLSAGMLTITKRKRK
jgi:uncharacterized membrane protein